MNTSFHSDIKHIICISSCKGGVGKSTVAVNLALAFQQRGSRVGLLDADIYGPSLPQMLNLNTRPELNANNQIVPLERFGIKCMSIGVLVPQDSALIWRGPLLHKALSQLYLDVDWGTLDILLIDMPPGTGDPYLTLSKKAPLTGAVIVSTPQELALCDVRRGADMLKKINIPILGIIENMSYFLCSSCDQKHSLFDTGGAAKEAKRLGIPLLGEIPLDPKLRIAADHAHPIALDTPQDKVAQIYSDLSSKLWRQISHPIAATDEILSSGNL